MAETETVRQRRDRAAGAFAGLAHEAEVLASRVGLLAARMQFVLPADRAAMDAVIAGMGAASKQLRWLSVRAKGER